LKDGKVKDVLFRGRDPLGKGGPKKDNMVDVSHILV
jgi:hypothetical protein